MSTKSFMDTSDCQDITLVSPCGARASPMMMGPSTSDRTTPSPGYISQPSSLQALGSRATASNTAGQPGASPNAGSSHAVTLSPPVLGRMLTSKYRGVFWCPPCSWGANAQMNFLGTFPTEHEAAETHDNAVRVSMARGDTSMYSELNFPTEQEREEMRRRLSDQKGGADGVVANEMQAGTLSVAPPSQRETRAERVPPKQQSSRFAGVKAIEKNKWRSRIWIEGFFQTEEQSTVAHDKLVREALREHGRPIRTLNFPTREERRQLDEYGGIKRTLQQQRGKEGGRGDEDGGESGSDDDDEPQPQRQSHARAQSDRASGETSRKQRKTSSQYHGITAMRAMSDGTPRWRAQLKFTVKGVAGSSSSRISLSKSCIPEEKEAARTYDQLARKALREHGRPIKVLNFPTDEEERQLRQHAKITEPLRGRDHDGGKGNEDQQEEEEEFSESDDETESDYDFRLDRPSRARTQNSKAPGASSGKRGSSQYCGVSLTPMGDGTPRWRAQLIVNVKGPGGSKLPSNWSKNSIPDEEEAARAHDELARKALREHGRPIRRLNFPTDEERRQLRQRGKITERLQEEEEGEEEFSQSSSENDSDYDPRLERQQRARTQESKPGASSRKQKSSKYYGITPNRKRWVAALRVNGTRKYLGTFDTEEEAAVAWDIGVKHALRRHGRPIDKLNFPTDEEKKQLRKHGKITVPLDDDEESDDWSISLGSETHTLSDDHVDEAGADASSKRAKKRQMAQDEGEEEEDDGGSGKGHYAKMPKRSHQQKMAMEKGEGSGRGSQQQQPQMSRELWDEAAVKEYASFFMRTALEAKGDPELRQHCLKGAKAFIQLGPETRRMLRYELMGLLNMSSVAVEEDRENVLDMVLEAARKGRLD